MSLIKYTFLYRSSSNDVLISTNDGLFSTIVSSLNQLIITNDVLNVPISPTAFINLHYQEVESINGQTLSALNITDIISLTTYLNNNCFNDTQPISGGTLSGISGSGSIGFPSQNVTPSVPTSGFKLYANSSNAFSWIGANGFVRTFDGTSNTANRTYTLPDNSGTFGLLGSSQTWTGVNTFSGSVLGLTKNTVGLGNVDNTSDINKIVSFINLSNKPTTIAGYGITDFNTLGDGRYIQKSNNLSDLASVTTARTNLGLGTLATQSGTFTSKQDLLNGGTGFVKSTAGTISYDNSTYLTNITSGNVTTALGYTPLSIVGGTLTGTGGNGFHGFIAQSSNPTTPLSGFNLFANSANALSWKGANGFVRTFDGISNTTDRTYTLPDASGTFSLLGSSQTFSGANIFTGTTIIGNGTTGTINLGDSYFTKTVGSGFNFNSGIISNAGIISNGAITLLGSQGIGIGVTPTTRLDIQGTTATDSAPLSSELLTSSNWTSTGWTGSFGTGFTHTTGNTTVLSNTLAPSSGVFYQITYTVTSRTAGTFDILFGGVSTTGLSGTGAIGILAISTGTLSITPTSTFDGTLVISIKQIGNSTALVTYRNSSGIVVNEYRNSGTTNIFQGLYAGSRLTTGFDNTSIGYIAGQSITSGNFNTFIGSNSGVNNTTGYQNTAIGYNSLRANTIGYSNTANGYLSLTSNTTGYDNLAIGNSSLLNNTTGNSNIAIGKSSLNSNLGGATNIAIGINSLLNNITGSGNLSLGTNSGRFILGGIVSNTAGTSSIFLGQNTYPLADNQTNQTVIGYQAVGNGSNTTVIGNTSTTQTQLFGNLILSNSSQPTDDGNKLQVTGNSKFTGTIQQLSGNYQTTGDIIPTIDGGGNLGVSSLAWGTVRATNNYVEKLTERFGGSNIVFYKNDATKLGTMFSNGNWLIQTGGTHTDNGFKLDVNGTVRSQGLLTATGSGATYQAIMSNGYGITNNFYITPAITRGIALDLGGGFSNSDGGTPANTTVTGVNVARIQQTVLNAVNTGVTYTNASTLRIEGSPTAGTNVTITNPYALYVNSGNSYFGDKINVATGSNKSTGTATLVAGTVTVSTTAVKTGSLVWVQYHGSTGVATSVLTVPTITDGTSFVITAITAGATTTNMTDTNNVKWWIIN